MSKISRKRSVVETCRCHQWKERPQFTKSWNSYKKSQFWDRPFCHVTAVLDKLQRAQNAAARMLTRTRKFDHISPVLRNLHWLPIRQRIKYKLLLLTWKALHGMAPPYIQDLLKEYAPTRNLRSSSQHLLDSARTSTSYGDRAFSAVAPALWNALPTDIRGNQSIDTFCSKLKTHLFSSAFN